MTGPTVAAAAAQSAALSSDALLFAASNSVSSHSSSIQAITASASSVLSITSDEQQQQYSYSSFDALSSSVDGASSQTPTPVAVQRKPNLQAASRMRASLDANKRQRQFVARVQSLLIETRQCTQEQLRRAAMCMRARDWDEVVEERSVQRICAWPQCGAALDSNNDDGSIASHSNNGSGKKYRLSLSQKRVYRVDEHYGFCSTACHVLCEDYKLQLTDEPLAVRLIGRTKQQQQSQQSQQQIKPTVATIDQLAIALSGVSSNAVAQLASALPTNAAQQVEQLSIRESSTVNNNETSTDTQTQAMQIIITPPPGTTVAPSTVATAKVAPPVVAPVTNKRVSFAPPPITESTHSSSSSTPAITRAPGTAKPAVNAVVPNNQTQSSTAAPLRGAAALASLPTVPHVAIELRTSKTGELQAALVDTEDEQRTAATQHQSDSESDEMDAHECDAEDENDATTFERISQLAISERAALGREPLGLRNSSASASASAPIAPKYQRRKLPPAQAIAAKGKQASNATTNTALIRAVETSATEADDDAEASIQSDTETDAALKVIAAQSTQQGKVKTLSSFAMLLDTVLLWSTHSTSRFLATRVLQRPDERAKQQLDEIASPQQIATAQQALLHRLQLQVGEVRSAMPHILTLYEPIHQCVQTFNLIRGARLLATPDLQSKQWRMLLLMLVVALSPRGYCSPEQISSASIDCGYTAQHLQVLISILASAKAN